MHSSIPHSVGILHLVSSIISLNVNSRGGVLRTPIHSLLETSIMIIFIIQLSMNEFIYFEEKISYPYGFLFIV